MVSDLRTKTKGGAEIMSTPPKTPPGSRLQKRRFSSDNASTKPHPSDEPAGSLPFSAAVGYFCLLRFCSLTAIPPGRY